jgi:hypothetical protein
MFRSILHLTGIDQKLQAFKDNIESQAQSVLQQTKAVATQVGLVAAMGFGASILLLMAIVAALAVLYLWLAPQLGPIAAMAIVTGGLLAVGGGLALAAMSTGRKISVGATPDQPKIVDPVKNPAAIVAKPAALLEPPRQPVTAADVDSVFAVAGRFSRLPHTGIEPVDAMILALAPKAEDVTREAVARAANLVRDGDRKTMLAILATALAVGWAITKVDYHRGKSMS